MRPDRSTVKKRSSVIQGAVGVFCILLLTFAVVWTVKNAVTGLDDDSKIKTAEASSAAESNTDSLTESSAGTSGAETDSTVSGNTVSAQPGDDTSAAVQEAPAVTTAAPAVTKTNYTGWMTESMDETPDGGNASALPPTSTEITDDFSDAVFIGNSLTVGLSMNCGKPLATFYASTGLNVNSIWESDTIALDNGGYGTVFDALAQKQFARVYVMFGINEVGWPYWDVFQTNYIKVIEKIKELQPNAKIYIESILPVSSLAVNTDPVFTTENIDGLNEYVKNTASQTGTAYLDINSELRQADGSLPLEASTDGIHLLKDYCMIWLKYLADNR